MRDWGRTTCAVAVCLIAFIEIASAQPDATLIFEGGSARDVAGSPAGDALYIASYDSDEVVEIDPAKGEERQRVKVALGPSAIAVDSTGIAVLSRVAATVSILNPADLSARVRVPVTTGTNVLVSAGTGRIVAVNPFEGEICLIDTQAGTVLKHISLVGGVPVDAAYGGERIVVVARANSLAWSLDINSLDVIAQRTLTASPRAIVSSGAGRFVVETDAGLMILDGATLEASRPLELNGKSLDGFPGGVLYAAGGTALSFNADLESAGLYSLPEGAEAARWIGVSLVAWSPTLGRVWRTNTTTSQVIAEVAHPVASGPIAAPILATVAQTEPAVPEAAPIVAETAPQKAEPALAPAAVPEPEYRFTIQPSRLQLGGFKPYAPHFGDPTGRTFEEAVARALDAGADENSLLSGEFPDRIDDLKFGGQLRSVESEGRAGTVADGGVEFDLGNIHVNADRIELKSNPRELRLEGSPTLTRATSILTADRIHAFDTPLPDIPGFWPIVPSQRKKPVPHPLVPRGYKDPDPRSRLPLGTIEFDGVTWDETGRGLTADRIEMNTLARRANFTNAKGQAGPLYFGADSLRILNPRRNVAEDFWMTTCDNPDPHYRFRFSRVESEAGDALVITHARLQLGKMVTPLYVPRYAASLMPGERRLGTELKIAGSTELGSSVNVAQWFRLTDNIELAPRIYATGRQGTGVGFDAEYDFMEDPASAPFRSRGQLRTLYTTEQNGFTEWYHRQELTPDTVLLGQWEQWYEADFVKDFYSNDYDNRTGPRSFLSVAHTRPEYQITGTVAPSTNDFTQETEKLPELSFHLFERKLGGGFYGTFDAVGGYYKTSPETVGAARTVALARLSYDWNVARGFNVLPFVELDGTYYSQTLDETGDAFLGTATAGITMQSRLQRSYPGLGRFTGFKHIIIPSTTISYQPDATLDAAETPQFDALDKRPGRLRVENTLDNILLGRNSVNGKVWPVARLTFYHGHDLENEAIQASDYEVDVEVRPRPAWGMRTSAEIHDVSNSSELPGDDFNRLITYAFYDDKLHKNTLNGRVGFAYTESGSGVVNQEILYGMGYKIAAKWSVAFEHRYDFEREEFTRQTYSVRRKLHDWEIGLTLRDRQDSFDIGIQINLVDFPEIGTRL